MDWPDVRMLEMTPERLERNRELAERKLAEWHREKRAALYASKATSRCLADALSTATTISQHVRSDSGMQIVTSPLLHGTESSDTKPHSFDISPISRNLTGSDINASRAAIDGVIEISSDEDSELPTPLPGDEASESHDSVPLTMRQRSEPRDTSSCQIMSTSPPTTTPHEVPASSATRNNNATESEAFPTTLAPVEVDISSPETSPKSLLASFGAKIQRGSTRVTQNGQAQPTLHDSVNPAKMRMSNSMKTHNDDNVAEKGHDRLSRDKDDQRSAKRACISAKRTATLPATASHRTTSPSIATSRSAPLIVDSSDSSPNATIENFGSSTGGRSVSGQMTGRQPPDWYNKLEANKKRERDTSGVDELLAAMKTQIGKMRQDKTPNRAACINKVRECLHKLVFQQVTPQLLRNQRMLHNADGLPCLFDQKYCAGVEWPFDVKADALQLYRKWCRQDFDTTLLRGIIPGKPKAKSGGKVKSDHNCDRLDPEWTKKFPPGQATGHNGLVNGQWFPTQLAALRDGAHGCSQAGIYHRSEEGAYSVILSGGHDYDDVDNGDEILYNGTSADDDDRMQTTKHTNAMLARVGSNTPIRVLRSYNLKSRHAPKTGFRYDGLYYVAEVEREPTAENSYQRYRFRLKRCTGQDPIRSGENNPAARPTKQEMDEYAKDKRLRGFT